MDVEMVLMGHSDDSPDDPVMFIPPSLVDHKLVRGPVAKERREDVQVWDWLTTMSHLGFLRHPVGIVPGDDPPDRVLLSSGDRYPVELTEMTLQAVRGRLAEVRQVGRQLDAVLAGRPDDYAHLVGRMISVQDVAGHLPGATAIDVRRAVSGIAYALEEDRGVVGEGLDLAEGLPEYIADPRGVYADVDGFAVLAHAANNAESGDVQRVVASSAAEISLSELRALFWSRVAAKDHRSNQILVMSTGLVDGAGYVCPPDQWLFKFLVDNGVGDAPVEPEHLDAVVLHAHGGGGVMVAYRRDNAALPWAC